MAKDKGHKITESNLEEQTERAEIYRKGYYGDDLIDVLNPKGQKVIKNTKATQKELNSTFSQNLKKNLTMTVRGIDGQIDLLEDMNKFLENFNNHIEDIIKDYQNYLTSLDQQGLDELTLEQLTEYYETTKSKLENITRDIEEDDIDYIIKVRDHLDDTPR